MSIMILKNIIKYLSSLAMTSYDNLRDREFMICGDNHVSNSTNGIKCI